MELKEITKDYVWVGKWKHATIFFGEGQINNGDCMGTRWRALWSYGVLLCVYLYPPQEEQVTKERSRGVQGGLYAPIPIDADAEIEA